MAGMSDRTTWKDDVHGLSLGASLADLGNRDNEDRMRALREKMASKISKHDWVMSAYGTSVSTCRDEKVAALSATKDDSAKFIGGTIAGSILIYLAWCDAGTLDQHDWVMSAYGTSVSTCRDEKVAALSATKDDSAKFIGGTIAGSILIYLAWCDAGTLDQRINSWTESEDTIGSIRPGPELSYGTNAGLAKTVKNFKRFDDKYMSDPWADRSCSDGFSRCCRGPGWSRN